MSLLKLKKGFSVGYAVGALALAGTAGFAGKDLAAGLFQDSYALTEIQQMSAMRASVQSTFHRHGYDDLSNAIVRRMVNTPAEKLRAGGDTLMTHWADDGLRFAPANVSGLSGRLFSMTYSEVPQRACVNMVQNFDNYERVEVNGDALFSKNLHDYGDVGRLDIELACDLEEGNTIAYFSS